MKLKVMATAAVLAWSGTITWAETVAVITPYLAQPGTQAYVEGFQAKATEAGWTVNVIDTAGDVAAVIARIEDAVTQKVDASDAEARFSQYVGDPRILPRIYKRSAPSMDENHCFLTHRGIS